MSHAALTRSPRESASQPNALAPTTATRIHPSHESHLLMRVPSLGVTLPPNWPCAVPEATAGAASCSLGLPCAQPTAQRDGITPFHQRPRGPRARRQLYAAG